MSAESNNNNAPDTNNTSLVIADKPTSLVRRIRNTIISIVNWPFKMDVENMMRTLKKLKPNSEEIGVINDAIKNKYVPSLRNSFLSAIFTTPGILTVNDTSEIRFVLAIISSITGIAWFAISLKEVKKKFTEFGIELTQDMLKAFLTTTFTISIMSGASMVSAPVQWVIQMAHESGIDLSEMFSSQKFQIIAPLVSLVGFIGIVRNLTKSIIKFDGNDTMLTGSSDAAKTFFNRSISELRNTASLLKGQQHSLEAANFQISLGVRRVYQSLLDIDGIDINDIIPKDDLDYLSQNTDDRQGDFDKKLLPILEKLILLFEGLIKNEGDQSITMEVEMAINSNKRLKERYEEDDNDPDQEFADSVIANNIEIIADLIERYGDELSTSRKI